MTDTFDDEIIQINKSTTRRPMHIETEVRTDTVTRQRVGSKTITRDVYEILENTRSPTDGLPPTTYTYAHSVSYMPVTENGSYVVPVMARRDLHGSYSSFNSGSASSALASPTKFIHDVGTKLVNSYSSIRNRFTQSNGQDNHEQLSTINQQTSSSFLGSPTTRISTRSSTNNTNTLVHSTPRESEIKVKKIRQRQDEHQQQLIDDDYQTVQDEKDSHLVRILKQMILFPLNTIGNISQKICNFPWWILIPLLLVLGFFLLPNYGCKPFEHYPESKLYQNCIQFQKYTSNLSENTNSIFQKQIYNRFVHLYRYISIGLANIRDFFVNQFNRISNLFQRRTEHSEILDERKGSVQSYCDSGLAVVRNLYDDLKKEWEKLFTTNQQQDLESLIRQIIDEYAADETGEADYALEANGGKIVDTRCTEYTDEPRQNVVKFLGIPIVHMSKQPNIMIKAGRMPGQCFPFRGDQGSVIIKLAVPVRPTEFAVEHLSKNISIVGHINSAPKNLSVYALKDKHDREGILLGQFVYDAEKGPSLQRFKPNWENVPLVEYIEVRVTSNWGNPNYTCLYRFRVHGSLQSVQPSAPPAA